MREKFRQFMIGRYGTDGLNQFLSMSSIVMLLVSLLTRVSLFTWLGAALLILCYYRSLSPRRAKQTRLFLSRKRYLLLHFGTDWGI